MNQRELFNKLRTSPDHKEHYVELGFKVFAPKDWTQEQVEKYLVSYVWGPQRLDSKHAAELFGKEGDEAMVTLE